MPIDFTGPYDPDKWEQETKPPKGVGARCELIRGPLDGGALFVPYHLWSYASDSQGCLFSMGDEKPRHQYILVAGRFMFVKTMNDEELAAFEEVWKQRREERGDVS